jgi:hypothetical protein
MLDALGSSREATTMSDIKVTFDPRKIGTENPITVSPAICRIAPGARRRLRFTLRTVGGARPATFALTPLVFAPGSPLAFEEPVPVGSTSFVLLTENRNRSPLPQRLHCTVWVRWEGQSYPALHPTIVHEPSTARSSKAEEAEPAMACAA